MIPHRSAFLVIVTLTVLLVLVTRLRFAAAPLERDEGEYAYMGQLMLEGIAPFRMAANMKLPGTAASYALLMAVLGQTPTGIHLGILLINLLAAVLVVAVGRELFGLGEGLLAGAFFALLSLAISVQGLAGHATHFVTLAALGGFLLMLRWRRQRKIRQLVAAGLLFGLGFLMKQPGIFLALGGMSLLWLPPARDAEHSDTRPAVKEPIIYAISCAIPLVITCLIIWFSGVFGEFKFWVFDYAWQYGTIVTLSEGVQYFRESAPAIFWSNPGIWLAALAGAVVLWQRVPLRPAALPVTIFTLSAALAACPGLYFRGHYFIPLLPAAALLAAVACLALRGRMSAILLAGMLLASGIQQRDVLFVLDAEHLSRHVYGGNPFPEAVKIAEYLSRNSRPEQPIAVLGSEPEIYFYSRRRSATKYIYTYGLMEPQAFAARMQDDMIRELETARPAYVVFVSSPGSWVVRPESSQKIFQWWSAYAREHYEVVGVADPVSEAETVYRWDAEVTGYRPRSAAATFVLRRRW